VVRSKSTQDPQRLLDRSSVWTGEYVLQNKLDYFKVGVGMEACKTRSVTATNVQYMHEY
jgi:hypothetical protein